MKMGEDALLLMVLGIRLFTYCYGNNQIEPFTLEACIIRRRRVLPLHCFHEHPRLLLLRYASVTLSYSSMLARWLGECA